MTNKINFQSAIIDYFVSNSQSILAQLKIISLGILVCFIQLGLLLYSTNKPLDWFNTPLGLLSVVFFFLFFAECAFLIAYISSFAFWIVARKLKGNGTFNETCTVLLSTALYTVIPLGFFFVFFVSSRLFQGIASLGGIASLCYGIIRLHIQVAKIYHMSVERASVVILLGTLLQAPFVGLFFYFLMNYAKVLFIGVIPITIQLIVTLAVVGMGLRIFRKLKNPIGDKNSL